MIKAIVILQELLNYEEEAKAKVEIQEAIAELTAHKAKIQGLKEYCKTELAKAENFVNIDVSGAALGSVSTLKNILQKLKDNK